MGATTSKTDIDEKVFYHETPIQFSQDVVNHILNKSESPETSVDRQTDLDATVRSRIQEELLHLRKEEESMRREIEHALERENLDRERSMAGETLENTTGDHGATHGDIKSSVALLGDIEEIQKRVDRYHLKQELSKFPDVKASSDAVTSCYRAHTSAPLECWQEVAAFKLSVARLEQQYITSL